MKLGFLAAVISVLVSGTAYGGARTTAVPIDPASWLSYDDYPVSAVKARQQGVVSYRVFVGDDGGVVSCIVTKSSGVPVLDNQTCASVMQRARFMPAKDRAGRAREGTYDGRVTWIVPEDPGVGTPPISIRWVFLATLDADGALVNCTTTFGAEEKPTSVEMCRSIRETAMRGGFVRRPDAPDGIVLVNESTTEFTEKPVEGKMIGATTEIGQRTIRFHIDATGHATACKDEKSGVFFSISGSPCDERTQYRTFDGTPVETDGVLTDRSGWRRRPSPDGV